MEYLVVHCTEKRLVRVDGVRQGETEELLELEAGTYIVTLDPTNGCRPERHLVVLTNTTTIVPCEVTFAVA